MRPSVKFVSLFVLCAAGATGVLLPRANAADPTDTCFARLPFGCNVVKSETVTGAALAAVSRRLGVPLKALSNTQLSVQGGAVRVNLLEAGTADEARRLHAAIAKTKDSPAFCLLNGRTVVEFCKADAATATKAAYELGLVPKPRRIVYRVTAQVATVRTADYMALNELFNLFRTLDLRSPGREAADRIASLSKGFTFGNALTLRARPGVDAASAYRITPAPAATQALADETIAYTFDAPPKVLEVPCVTLTADIACDATGRTPTTRTPAATLLAATPFWPVNDPEIAALARKITAGRSTPEAKVQALLAWLAPGLHLKSSGPTGSRWGVKKALEQGYGHCWDSSDCFVTLARAAGIPARQVAGWLYGTSGHVWAEVLVAGKGWQQVDPTGTGRLECGIYHIPYFTTESGELPILYVAMPRVEIVSAE